MRVWESVRLSSLAAIGAASALCASASVSLGDDTDHPNVVLVFIDDMGAADWQFHPVLNPTGSFVFETPNMLRLAGMGVSFTNGYSSSPVCSPARAALMSGKSAANIGITDFIGAGSNASGTRVRTTQSWVQNIPLDDVLLPEALRDAGYRTAFFGKWHLGQGSNASANPLLNGFELNVAGTNSGNPGFAGGFFAGADGAWSGMPGLSVPNTYAPGEYLSDAISEQAAGYISANAAGDDPFFVMLSHYVVHTPIEAPAALVTYYQNKIASLPAATVSGHDNATYAAMVQKMDESLGRVLDALEDPDSDPQSDDSILDDTIVIFTADNGGLTNFSITDNRPFRDGKGSMYEGGIREPFIVAQPGNPGIAQGVASETPVIGYDVYPTILDLAGVEGDPEQNAAMDGLSLAPALAPPSAPGATPTDADVFTRDLFWHYPHRSPQAVSNNQPVAGGSWVSAVRRGDSKLLYFYDERRFELYDVGADQSEATDLFAADPMAAAAMSRALAGHLDRVGASMPRDIGNETELPGPGIVAEALVPAGDALLTDLFDAPRDFKADGTDGTEWDGVMNASNAAALDRDLTNAGELVFRNNSDTRFVAGGFSAPFLYREVAGDFEATMRIGDLQDANFHVMALVAADPDGVADDFLWVGQQDRSGGNDFAQSRDIAAGVRTANQSEPGTYGWYRLVRRGDAFTTYYSADGLAWIAFTEYDRPDMPGVLRVGVSQGLFGSETATGTLDFVQIVQGCEADLADPIGRLDSLDVRAFIDGIGPGAFGSLLTYLRGFDAGCALVTGS